MSSRETHGDLIHVTTMGYELIEEKDMIQTVPIERHSGNKYIRTIHGCNGASCQVDVYAVLVAFNVTCPATQHAVKKLLCAGIRGKGNTEEDLAGARDSIHRAIEMERARVQSVVVKEIIDKQA